MIITKRGQTMNTPLNISKEIKSGLALLREFSGSDCHLEDLVDCYGLLKSRLDEAEKLKKEIQAKLIEKGHLTESGDTIQSDSFRVLFTLRAKSGRLDKIKLETKYPDVFADVWTRGYGSSPVITSKSVA